SKVDRRRRVEVANLWKIGPLVRINPFDRLGNDEVEIGVALAVSVGAKVNRHAVGKEGHVRPVVGIEPSNKVLVGLACTTKMLDCYEPGNKPKHLGWATLRLEKIFLVRDELL